MILAWFDTKEVDALAAAMARDLAKRVPPASIDARGQEGRGEAEEDARPGAAAGARLSRGSNKLNVYTKARLANQFKWALLEAGYPKAFVDAMTYELATVVAAAQSRRRVTRSPL